MDRIMKLPKDTGRRENLLAFAAWILLAIVYYCVISLFLRGFIFFGNSEDLVSISEDLGSIGIIVVSVIAGLLTVRPLFSLYLSWKAYRVQKGPGWKAWRERRR